ncbi:MAG: hypothetical protein LBQ33_00020 [Oscillospiraceae bacterium]|jgi:hypothetical protein|nr:hypothetical protein [Oscillospiraceae bacterium]
MTAKKRRLLEDCRLALTGALLMGFLWHMRGRGGFGGMLGMLAVALGMLLFAASLTKGQSRGRATLPWLFAGAALTAVTAGGWGTVNAQMTGVLDTAADGTMTFTPPLSGAAMMLALGFSWMPFFGLALGYLWSGREWRVKNALALTALYPVVELLCKASLGHGLVALVSPASAALFREGLARAGQAGLSAWGAYMQHFNHAAWAEDIAGGRNYFYSVEILSRVLAAAALLLFTRFVLKDKKAAQTGLLISCFAALGITAADLFLFFGRGGYHYESPAPQWLQSNAWELWEYGTGFFIGLGVGLLAVCARKNAAPATATAPEPGQKIRRSAFCFYGLTAAAFAYLLCQSQLDWWEQPVPLRTALLGWALIAAFLALLLFLPLLLWNKHRRGLLAPGGLPGAAGWILPSFAAALFGLYVLYELPAGGYAPSHWVMLLTALLLAAAQAPCWIKLRKPSKKGVK